MKTRKSSLSSQLLILILAGIGMIIIMQVAQAQVIEMNMPKKTVGKSLLENTTLNYYHQFLGPTVGGAVAGTSSETYNVFVDESSPYQSFHSASLRFQLNPDWAVGASLAAVNAYGDSVTSQQTGDKMTVLRDEFFNATAFVTIPTWDGSVGTLHTTLSYEAPTSNTAKQNEMKYGAVISQNVDFKLTNKQWNTGVMWQYYRMFYKENVITHPPDYYFPGSTPDQMPLQTTIFSGGPYLGYRFNEKWGFNSTLTFDWDQRGNQADTGSFNNNLPDRLRAGISYYPTFIKQIANIGLFTQSTLKYSADKNALGAEFALKF